MNLVPNRYDDLSNAIASTCDRFVHPATTGEAALLRARRFIGLMLFAPVLITGAATLLLTGHFGASATLAIVLFTFAISWMAVLAAASIRSNRWLEPLALIAGVAVFAALVFTAGGLGSPAAIMLLALPIEAYWIARSRIALIAGGIAVALAAGLSVLPEVIWPGLSLGASAWQWLLPLAYGATLWPRAFTATAPSPEATIQLADERWLAMTGGIALQLSRNGDVAAAQGFCERLPGLAPDLLLGAGLFERIHVADRVGYMYALDEVRDGRDNSRAEIRLRLPRTPGLGGPDDFQPFIVDLHSVGIDTGFVAVLRDNAQIGGLQAELRAAKDETAALEIAKGRFLAAVSHELRTPLNAIIGFSDILLHKELGGFIDARQSEYAELIKESGHHLLAIVNSILDVSKIEAGTYPIHTEAFAFGDAVEMCRSMMSLQAEKKKVALHAEVSRTIGDLVADRRAIQQILINLVSNAIKFTPEQGSVVIGSRRVGSRLHFWVEDTGIGMMEEDLERIGRPFTQIRNDYTRQFEGTGLGLSLVKGLVALHEGTMSIESAPGQGTKVAISMPVDGPRLASNDSVPAEASHEVDHGTLRKTA